MADPIVPQSIVAAPATEHQSWLDRIESALVGAWRTLESVLPEHELKGSILDAVKGAYDNSVKVVRDDLAELGHTAETEAKDVAETAVSGAEGVVEAAAAAVEAPAATDPTQGTPSDSSADSSTPTTEVPAQTTTEADAPAESVPPTV